MSVATETKGRAGELFDLTGKVAIVTGSTKGASARRSPSGWPSTGPG